VTGLRVRFALFVAFGLVLFAAVALFYSADWTCLSHGRAVGFMDCQSGDPVVGDGLGGRIGIAGVVVIGALAFVGLTATWLAELLVRRRTRLGPGRGEPRGRRP
jgi:hypothetical protein